MNTVGIDSFSQETMSKIFSQIMKWHFNKGFSDTIALQGNVLTRSFGKKNTFFN